METVQGASDVDGAFIQNVDVDHSGGDAGVGPSSWDGVDYPVRTLPVRQGTDRQSEITQPVFPPTPRPETG